LFLQFYPSFKDRFDSECNNLGTGYIENCRNLRTSLIAFIGGSKYKEVWHERTKQTPVRGPAPPDPIPSGVIRVSYPSYGPFGSSQLQFMEFIPTPRFSKK